MLVGPVAAGRLPACAGRQAGAPVLLGAAPLRQAPARAGEASRPCPGGVCPNRPMPTRGPRSSMPHSP
eukprot:6428656-Alexandrium_andersonii.AAC.1